MSEPIGLPAAVGHEVAEISDFEVAARTGRSRVKGALVRDPAFWLGAVGVAALVTLAVLAPLIAPFDPNFQHRDGLTIASGPTGPNDKFVLGADRLGRDVLSRLLHGARTSLAVGLIANLLATTIGVVVGAVAGYAGTPIVRIGRGRQAFELPIPIESILMRITDLGLSLPALLIAITLAVVFRPSLVLVVLVITLILWTSTARLVYGRILVVKQSEFVLAARAVGVSPLRIVLRHLLPHVSSVVLASAVLGIAATVLFESTLSFLGVGVPLPTASWGSMIAEHIGFYATQPRLVVFPAVAIMATVLAFNLLGDALRDALDPQGWR